jgi:MinD-like ATPase involved in chromosome partitioning or flagellar assembly
MDSKVIAFHSYKGGTGKTTCVVNLAALFASMGKKICLIDFDIYAPSLTSYFGVSPKYFIHDLLSGDADFHDVLVNYSRTLNVSGELYIGFSSPSKEDIHSIEIAYDNNFQIKALRQFLAVKRQLIEKEGFDYIFVDTSPGIRYWSINALASADILFLMLKINDMDISGTQKMIKEIYDSLTRYGLKTYLILNKVPGASPINSYEPIFFDEVKSDIEKLLGLSVFLSIPCYCDIQFNRKEYLWALNKPDHPFSMRIRDIPSLLEKI